MKVFVSGSMNSQEVLNRRDDFISACGELGAELAKSGHTIIVNSDSDRTADWFIVAGANSVTRKKKHQVIVYMSDGEEIPFKNNRARFEKIQFKYRKSKGSVAVLRTQMINDADCVIIIGGDRGTADVGYSARAVGKPVLAIPCFGGAANQVWDEILEPIYKQAGFLENGLLDLQVRWTTESAQLSVAMAEKLAKRNPFRSESLLPNILLLIMLVLLFLLWVVLFVFPLASRTSTFFLLLLVSVFLGTGLRNGIRLIFEGTRFEIRQLLNEALVGIGVAFGLSLLYLAGGMTITGKTEFISISTDDDFQRIAIVMSLLGFFSSFLLERAIQRLRKSGEGILAD